MNKGGRQSLSKKYDMSAFYLFKATIDMLQWSAYIRHLSQTQISPHSPKMMLCQKGILLVIACILCLLINDSEKMCVIISIMKL
ncbi:hypothetical protein D918_00330 [Trichuris suis]|nr:hypothetical protein D918_00330 [Trichuris suis]